MFKYLRRLVDDDNKKLGYLLLDLDSNEEVELSNKELKSKLVNCEIQIDGLILSDSGRVIEYDKEKEKLKSEKKQELESLFSMESIGEVWKDGKIDFILKPAQSGLLDILSALNGTQTIYEYNIYSDGSSIMEAENSFQVIGQDDKFFRQKELFIEENKEEVLQESKNLSVDDILDEINSKKEEISIKEKSYVLSLPITENREALLYECKVLFYNGELDKVDWEFFDELRKECKNLKLINKDFKMDFDYNDNNLLIRYKTFPVLVHNTERELIDITLTDFKLYKVAWIKGLKPNMIIERSLVKDKNKHLESLLDKSYIVLENESDFYAYIDSIGLPREWFILREAKTFKENDIIYKQLGVGVLFTPGLYQIEDDKCFIETILY